MGITTTLSRTNWDDVRSRKTGNPVAEDEILSLARSERLLIEDQGCLHVPRESGGQWELIPALTESDVARWLGIPTHAAHRLLIEAGAAAFATRERFFSPERLWRKQDIEEALERHAAQEGLDDFHSALELGLIRESYRGLAEQIPFRSKGRVLKVLLEAYRDRFLPRDTVWTTRTSLLEEFATNFNRRASAANQVRLQFCEDPGCEHVASDQCCNRSCRPGEDPRFVCPAHSNWVDSPGSHGRPPSLCPACAVAVRDGRLRGFRLL